MAKEPGKITLGGYMKFDPVKEAYIGKAVEELRGRGEFNPFLIALIKTVFETPEIVAANCDLAKMVDSYGVSMCGKKFFEESTAKVDDMHKKVDEIHRMCTEMYTLVKFGKHIGLPERVENIARAEFMLEKQINSICYTLGIQDNNIFRSNSSTDSISKQSDDILEFIINHYDNVVDEFKGQVAMASVPVMAMAGEFRNTVQEEDKTEDEKLVNTLFETGEAEAPEIKANVDVGSILSMMDGDDEIDF